MWLSFYRSLMSSLSQMIGRMLYELKEDAFYDGR